MQKIVLIFLVILVLVGSISHTAGEEVPKFASGSEMLRYLEDALKKIKIENSLDGFEAQKNALESLVRRVSNVDNGIEALKEKNVYLEMRRVFDEATRQMNAAVQRSVEKQ